MSQTVNILEFTRVTQARQIDEEQGVLYDLVALGPSSANGRDYPESTMREGLPLFEGCQSLANHSKEGSVYDVLGVWQDCRVEGGKVRGNFHYFKSHPLAPRLVEAARRPELNSALGFSINARGRMGSRDGRQVVESLESISSIDCVAQPASCKSLYESRTTPVKRKLKELIESLKGERPGYSRALKEMAEAGVMSPDAPMDAPPDAPAPDEDGDHKDALMNALKALCDEADTMDEGELIKKFKAILKLIKGDSGGGPDDTPADAGAAEESRKLKAENGRLLAEKVVRKAASAAGLSLTEGQVELVARPGMTEQQATSAIKELWGNGGASQRPRSAGPLTQPPAKAGNGTVRESKEDIPADPKARAAWLRRG